MTSDPGDGDSTPLCEPGQLELPRLTSIATEVWWAGKQAFCGTSNITKAIVLDVLDFYGPSNWRAYGPSFEPSDPGKQGEIIG
jgi:hypothetical protein